MSKSGNNLSVDVKDVAAVSASLKAGLKRGLRLVVDVTTVDMGRNAWALRDISTRSNVFVVASTGRHRQMTMPNILRSVDLEIERMINELTVGIEGGEIRAGVIGEIGTDGETFTEAEFTNFVAAAYAQAATGAPVITHTPQGRFGVEQAQLLISHGADPSKICVGHLDAIYDIDYYERLVEMGVWLALDQPGSGRFSPDALRIKILNEALEHGWQNRLLISGDTSHLSQMQSDWGFTYSFTGFWNQIDRRNDKELFHQIFCQNPSEFLSWPCSK
jgi:phosphotriesterase-related protein